MNKIIDVKLLKFILVGIVNTIVGTAIMFGLYNFAGCSYWVSSAANYILTSILSYVLNKYFTFGHKGNAAESGVRFAVNIAVCYLMAYGIAKPLVRMIFEGASVSIQENAAMLAGMCIFVGLNYIGQRFFVFREKEKMDYIKRYERWIKSPSVSEDEKTALKNMSDKDVYEAFYKYAEFGTSGMRGIMRLGTNGINRYTIRMASKGLAEVLGEGAKVAVAYDTRNHSKEFAEETAKVLAAAGISVLVFDRYSPVPLLSYAVRELGCDGGVVITASHNTKEYNGFKVYDSTGCQINKEFAGKIAKNMESLDDEFDIPLADISDANIGYIGDEIIEKFIEAAGNCGVEVDAASCRDLKVVYTSLHGSGRDYVLETLKRAGFENVSLVEQQAEYDGEFPTIRKPNPEDEAAFDIAAKQAIAEGADIIIATDPDCDRIGVAAADGDEIVCLTGNQTGALLVDFLASAGNCEGKKLLTTIVTGELGPAVAGSHGIEVQKLITGFKYIGAEMNEISEAELLMGYEESYGYLAGMHARDKDAVSSALLICQMAAYFKAKGRTLNDEFKCLYEKHGYWIDKQQSLVFEGSEGAEKMTQIMDMLRQRKSGVFADYDSEVQFLDYKDGVDGLPSANVLKYIFGSGSWLAVRPSGTEPKMKLYYCIKGSNKADAERLLNEIKTIITEIIEE